MNILYLSSMFDDDTLDALYDKGKTPNYAANKYHRLLCSGLAANGIPVDACSTLPISRRTCSKWYVRADGRVEGLVRRQYISVVNIPGIRHFMLFAKSFFKALFAAGDTVVLYDVLVMPSAYGAVCGAKLRRLTCVGIVTDLPEFMHTRSKGWKVTANQTLIGLADGYVFLTRQMNGTVNPKGKPFLVLEGHTDLAMEGREHRPFSREEKQVIYAGSLHRKYGIANLVEAFIGCRREGETLSIYGDGDYAPELVRVAAEHPCVQYHGSRPNDVVVEAELGAALLVNPRTGEGDYTKYSFPSKTLEYMASGTPVLAAKLPGIPDEYDRYLYYFDDRAPDGLEKALREVLDRDPAEWKEKGARAKAFVLGEKNNVRQAARILALIRGMADLR